MQIKWEPLWLVNIKKKFYLGIKKTQMLFMPVRLSEIKEMYAVLARVWGIKKLLNIASWNLKWCSLSGGWFDNI